MSDPDNQSTESNPVGRFMVATGAIIEHEATGKILLLKRSEELDWHPGDWELHYGRIAQFEDPEDGLKREINEETGIKDISIKRLLSSKHIYRGQKKKENDLIILTYYCTTQETDVMISEEHSAFEWVDAQEAIERVPVEGVKKDILEYLDYKALISRS